MSNENNGLFANTEGSNQEVPPETETETIEPVKATSTKKRKQSPEVILRMELKQLIKDRALVTSGASKLEETKAGLIEQLAQVDEALEKATAIGSTDEIDALIEDVKQKLFAAIEASV